MAVEDAEQPSSWDGLRGPLIVGVLTVVVGVAFLIFTGGAAFRSVIRPGESKQYHRLMSRGPGKAIASWDASVLDKITVTRLTNGNIFYRLPEVEDAGLEFPLYEHEEFVGNRASLGGVGVRLHSVAVYQPSPQQTSSISLFMPLRFVEFFDGDLNPVPRSNLTVRLPGYRTLLPQLSGVVGHSSFVFEMDQPLRVQSRGFGVFDRVTRQNLTGPGVSVSASRPRKYFGVTVQLSSLVPRPAKLVMEVNHGPATEKTVDYRIGESMDLPLGRIQVIGIETNHNSFRNHPANQSGGPAIETVPLKSGKGWSSGPALVLAQWPYLSRNFPMKFEIMDVAGKRIHQQSRVHSGHFTVVVLDSYRQKPEKIRFVYFPGRKRLVMDLPRIPGLPKENEGTLNLYSARFPYLDADRHKTEGDLQNVLATLLQYPRDAITIQNLPSSLPKYTNFTPAELIRDLRQRGAVIRVNDK